MQQCINCKAAPETVSQYEGGIVRANKIQSNGWLRNEQGQAEL